jgi:hypothetical protein
MVYFLKAKASANDAFPNVSTQGLQRPRGLSLMGGVPVADRLPKDLVFQVSDGTPVPGLTDFMQGVGVFVVSEKLKEVISKFHKAVEFIPVGIEYSGALHSGYSIFNPPLLVGGVDLDRSKLTLDENGLALSVDKLVLINSRFSDVPVCIVNEVRQIAVSDALGNAINAAECNGYKLVEPGAIRI